ncbi:MAG: hypothetical protein WC897_04180 [Candidatus Gracilibacteria bacterium]
MSLTGSLDRELVGKFVGNEPLGKKPMDPAMRKVSGPLVDSQTNMESDRLRCVENGFTSIVTDIATSQSLGSVASCDLFLNVLKNTLKGYLDDLEPSNREELKTFLLERAREVAEIPKNEVSYRAHALDMLEGMSGIFEEDLRMKVKKRLPVIASGASSGANLLHSDQRLMLGVKSFVRWALWGATAYTSWNGICEGLALLAHYGVLPENAVLINGIQYVFGVPVSLAISEIVRLGKQNIEFIGSTRGLGLIESTKVLFRERTKLAIFLFVVFGPDALTNVTGGMELFFGRKDSAAQIDVAKEAIDQNKKVARGELAKAKANGAGTQASVMATRASIDEALGTYGTPQGLGPRFYGLTAAYFSGEPYALINGPDDPRCKVGGNPVVHEVYKEWTIDVPEVGSLCAYGQLTNGFRGWIVGRRAGTGTIDSVLSGAASREGGEYAVANSKYLDFHNQHTNSYPDAIEALWGKYINGVEEKMNSRFAEVDEVTRHWMPEKSILANKEASKELIDPHFNAFEQDEKELRAQLKTDIKALGQPYAEFDQELVLALDPNNTAVKIDPPEFDSMDFNFQSVDVGNSFEEKNFIGKAISAIERNSMNLSLVGLVAFMSLILGYLDMGFFWSVQKAYANDMDRIRKVGSNTRQQMQEFLEALHTHLNRGPFSSMYTSDGGQSPTNETFVRGRFVDVMTGLSESMRFETVEEGLLLGSASRIVDKELASTHSWKEELVAFFGGMTRIESPAIRAFNRLVRAVEDYSDDPEVLEQHIMSLGNEGVKMNPSELIIAIRDQGKASTGKEMSDRFRSEMGALIGCDSVDDSKHSGNLAERTSTLEKAIHGLLVRKDIGEEAWLLDAVVVQEEIVELKEVDVLSEGEGRQRENLLKNYSRLIVALDKQLTASIARAEEGIRAVSKGVDSNKEEEARRAYEPEFARLEQAIQEARYVLHKGAFASKINPFSVLRILEERLQTISDIEGELKKLTPDPTSLRDRKMTLKARCATVRGELQVAKSEFGGEVLERIYNNRGNELIHWNDENLSGDLTSETARSFIDTFVNMYQRFYSGAPGFVEVNSGENLDAENVSLAFNHFAKELRENLDSFGFDEGMSRQFDLAWHIGTKLQEAFTLLNILNVGITVPTKLPALRYITINSK